MLNINFERIKRIHFIGIGGIGISAIARMMFLEGKEVSGSDLVESIITKELKKLGISIAFNERAENISNDIDLVIYTIAIEPDNLELLKAKELNIRVLTYPEVLGLISKEKYTIAIAGTHGKTTTTAMLAKVMVDADLKPTVIVGSLLDGQTNFITGEGKYLVVEACEYRRSFLNLSPNILIITNIDLDHLDYYKDLEDIQDAFSELAGKIPEDGYLICDTNNKNLEPVILKVSCKVIDYSTFNKEDIKLKVSTKYNRQNACAVLSTSKILGIIENQTKKSLEKFSGVWRRFQFRGRTKHGALVYDDYAHHPTEISAMFEGAREMFPDKRIIAIFQPHLFSRTRDFLKGFSECFKKADLIILIPVYEARKELDHSVNSITLKDEIEKQNKEVLYFETIEETINYLKKENNSKDLIITVGAGNVYQIVDKLI